MINAISIYRRLFASLLAMWMSLIVISGVVFMHKEVTSDGEIITHIHPYDFTKKKNKHQHKNDAEIRYLDVVYQGTFLEHTFTALNIPIRTTYEVTSFQEVIHHYYSKETLYHYLRGPPSVA